MSGTGAAPNDPDAMRAWLDGEPAYAKIEDGKVVIKNAASPIAGPGVILTGGVMTVDPEWMAKLTAAAAPPAPGSVAHATIGFLPATTAAPTPRVKATCIVASSSSHARSIMKQMGMKHPMKDDRTFFVTSVGGSLIGHRFQTILLTAEAQRDIEWNPKANDWFRENLQCRLDVDGVVVRL